MEAIHRSGARFRDYIPGLFGYQPYRCHNCFRRFYSVDGDTKILQPTYVHISRKMLLLPPVLLTITCFLALTVSIIVVSRNTVPPRTEPHSASTRNATAEKISNRK